MNNDIEWVPACQICGNMVGCVCRLNEEHTINCPFRFAANLKIGAPCKHGFQACPICDPCICGLTPKGIR